MDDHLVIAVIVSIVTRVCQTKQSFESKWFSNYKPGQYLHVDLLSNSRFYKQT